MDKIINITIHYGPLTKTTDAEASKINKERLHKIIRKELGFSKDKKFSLTRKSKRSKTYVPLKDSTDYRALNRSLEVKNHLKLKVEDALNEATGGEIREKSIEKTETVTISKQDYKRLMSKIEDIHKSVIKDDVRVAGNHEPLAVHKDVFCDACSISDNVTIIGDRYKCRRCHDYDLCSTCYKSGKASGNHSAHHEMLRIPGPAEALFPVYDERKQTEQQPFAKSNIDKNCIFVDIPVDVHESKDYESEIVDFVNTYNDVSKLKDLKQKLATFEMLVKLTNNNEDLLFDAVKSYVDSQKSEAVSTSPKLSVELSKVDQTLVFHLRNNGTRLTPENLSLIFSYLNKGSLTKFSLSIGPHAIYPDGFKRLYYNMNGIGNDFFEYSGKFTIELVKEDGEKYASGLCSDGSGVVFLRDTELKEVLETEDEPNSSSSSSSTTEKYLSASNSSFVLPNSDVETKVESDQDESDEDFKGKRFDEETDDNADEVTIAEEALNHSDDQSSLNEKIHSSTTTLTPEFVRISENGSSENIDDNSVEFTDDEIDDDAESFVDDYEELSTDDSYTENEGF